MKKLNFKKITSIAVGAAVGSVVANGANTLLTRFTSGMDPKTGPIVRGLGMIFIGTVGPDMVGQKGPTVEAAGTVIAAKGVEQILKQIAPSMVSGFDEVAGPDEEEGMDGIEDEEGLISGPDPDGPESVSGVAV